MPKGKESPHMTPAFVPINYARDHAQEGASWDIQIRPSTPPRQRRQPRWKEGGARRMGRTAALREGEGGKADCGWSPWYRRLPWQPYPPTLEEGGGCEGQGARAAYGPVPGSDTGPCRGWMRHGKQGQATDSQTKPQTKNPLSDMLLVIEHYL